MFVFATFLFLFGELSARVFWFLKSGIAPGRPETILYAFYPELRTIDECEPKTGRFDVLLLGGSVLHPDWGTIRQELEEQLVKHGYSNLLIHNLSRPAHTSRDSLLKYQSLKNNLEFDLVVLYHGINDSRANNISRDLFRLDYGHIRWYEILNVMASHHNRSWFSLPYTLAYGERKLHQLLNAGDYIPAHDLEPQGTHLSEEALSARAFEENLRAIVKLSQERSERLMLMTFAYYVPEDYSAEAFENKILDFTLHLTPVSVWGSVESVSMAVEAHNEIVRRLVREDKCLLFVDQDANIEDSSENFNDPCHLTCSGSRNFATHIVDEVLDSGLFLR